MKLDLHLHSNVSDGRLAPTDVVRAALAGGLDVIALTDHDTSVGVADAQRAAAGSPLFVVPGIEISTCHGIHDLHLLGYWIDTSHPALLQHQETARLRRETRMRGMIQKLQAMKIGIEFEDVVAAAGPEAQVLGRPHLARALFEAGYVRYYGEAFDRFLRDGGPAFVMEAFPSVAEAIDLIHTSGGLAVWAHPPRELFEREIHDFAAAGLDGVECLRPFVAPSESQYLRGVARELGLLVTGGSDWHGPHSIQLGEFFLRPPEIREFLETEQSAPLRR
jgi:3',5'-nucleoside bisphosphate phosphatase